MVAILLDCLHRADGSAQFSHNGYKVIASVNGPVEVQRRDELADRATIDVGFRPASGVGGVREKHFESLLERMLQHLIQTETFPRSLIQVTVQIMTTPPDDRLIGSIPQAASNLPILAPSINAVMLALMSSGLPLKSICTSTLAIISDKDGITIDPSLKQLRAAKSIHVFAFTSAGQVVMEESEGLIDIDEYVDLVTRTRQACITAGTESSNGDVEMDQSCLLNEFRTAIALKVNQRDKWKG